jgi:hypothetical protein
MIYGQYYKFFHFYLTFKPFIFVGYSYVQIIFLVFLKKETVYFFFKVLVIILFFVYKYKYFDYYYNIFLKFVFENKFIFRLLSYFFVKDEEYEKTEYKNYIYEMDFLRVIERERERHDLFSFSIIYFIVVVG